MRLKNILVALVFTIIGALAWQLASYYLSPESWVKIDTITRNIFPNLPVDPYDVNKGVAGDVCLSQNEVVNAVTNLLQIDSANELALMGIENPIVKWRENDDEPYRGYPLDSANEYIIYGEPVEENVRKLGDGQSLISLLNDEYSVHQLMDIPVYKYPSGELARKLGIKRGNERFLIGVYGITTGEEDPNINSYVTVYCTEPDEEIVEIYDDYLRLPHKYTSETSVAYEDLGNNLGRVTLTYPGSTMDYQASEFWDITVKPWAKVYETGQFPPCTLFERLRIGSGNSCYLPDKKEFSVISY